MTEATVAQQQRTLEMMLALLEPVPVRRTAGQVLREITAALRVSGVEPGDRLPGIEELAAVLQVSRAVVREATDILRRAGVIDVRRGQSGGVFMGNIAAIPRALLEITHSLPDAVPELMELRTMLQRMACLLAAERGTPEGIAMMRASVARTVGLRSDELMDIGAQFFCIVGHISGNRWLEKAMHDVVDRSSVIGIRALQQSKIAPELVDQAIEYTALLCQAIIDGDAERIIDLNERHMAFTTEVLVGVVEADPRTEGASRPDAVDTISRAAASFHIR